MASNDFFDDKIYDLYYKEVGRYPVLLPAEERALLVRYHCCPLCKRQIPPRTDATNCPSCGAVAPDELTGREYTCAGCNASYAPVVNSEMCPDCGSGRDMEALAIGID